MRTIDVGINAGAKSVSAFKILRRFDPSIELGPSLVQLRSGGTVVSVETSGRQGVNLLNRLLTLVNSLDAASIPYTLTITSGSPNIEDGYPVWPKRPGTRADIVCGLAEEEKRAKEAEEMVRRSQAWLASPEGQLAVAISERLSIIRDFLRSRWDRNGFESLRASEKNYVYVWWLYWEVFTGGFEQYFFNSYGDASLLAMKALNSIGAKRSHEILSDALALFEPLGGFQSDRQKRWEHLEALPDHALRNVTQKFYEVDEDVCSIALLAVERDYQQACIEVTKPDNQDRDRGPDYSGTPPTPPSMRVRTRRFDTWEQACSRQ